MVVWINIPNPKYMVEHHPTATCGFIYLPFKYSVREQLVYVWRSRVEVQFESVQY